MCYYDEVCYVVWVGGLEYDMEKFDELSVNGGDSVKVSVVSLSRINKVGGKGGWMFMNYGGSGCCCICFDFVVL